jgi:hypothetical protein
MLLLHRRKHFRSFSGDINATDITVSATISEPTVDIAGNIVAVNAADVTSQPTISEPPILFIIVEDIVADFT